MFSKFQHVGNFWMMRIKQAWNLKGQNYERKFTKRRVAEFDKEGLYLSRLIKPASSSHDFHSGTLLT